MRCATAARPPPATFHLHSDGGGVVLPPVLDVVKVIGKTLVASPERRQEADGDWGIVLRVQGGEVAAFDQLILKYRARVHAIIYNLTSNREDAADLAQDTFIKAFQSIQRFQGQSSFFTWLYRIAVNSTLSHLRKNRMRSFFSLERISEDEPVAKEIVAALTEKAGAEKETYVRELQDKLNEAMQKLSIKHRTVVTLFEIDGLSHEEIAEITGSSVGTVRSRLHYAKRLLQAELQPYLRQ
jgi:RNA polymerase sigma factor (sigma-70 family)